MSLGKKISERRKTMNLSPGVREMHSHLQSEWGFVLQGGARVTAVDEMGRNFIADCKPSEGWIFVKPMECDGGSIRILDHENFPACTTIAAALVEIEPGAMREIHWHSNNDELQYYIKGEARMTVFRPGPKARTFNYRAGDVGYVPVGNFHYVQNIGKEKVIFLEIFNSNYFSDISLAQWIAMTPREVVKSALNLSDEFLDNVRKESCPVVKYKGFEFPSANATPQNIRYFKEFDYKIKKPCNAAKEH